MSLGLTKQLKSEKGWTIFGLGPKYLKLAEECATNILEFSGIKYVSIITDMNRKDGFKFPHEHLNVEYRYCPTPDASPRRDQIDTTEAWLNKCRRLSVFSTFRYTISIDADFLVSNTDYDILFDALSGTGKIIGKRDFMTHISSISVADGTPLEPRNLPFNSGALCHATVMAFDTHSKVSSEIFKAWEYVNDNYEMMAMTYGFPTLPYRNDYALTIALMIYNGNQPMTLESEYAIPWPLSTLRVRDHLEPTRINGKLSFKCFDTTSNVYSIIGCPSMHILNKKRFLEYSDGIKSQP